MICFLDEEQFVPPKTHCLYIYDQIVQYFTLDEYKKYLKSKIIPTLIDVAKDTIKTFPDIFIDSFKSNRTKESDIFIIKNYLYIISVEKFKIEQELTLQLREKFLESFSKNERQRR